MLDLILEVVGQCVGCIDSIVKRHKFLGEFINELGIEAVRFGDIDQHRLDAGPVDVRDLLIGHDGASPGFV